MGNDDRHHFASIFHDIAKQLDDGIIANKSFLSAFFGKEVKDMKDKSNDIV
jgi:HD superfamily phosphohydrolase YqeK